MSGGTCDRCKGVFVVTVVVTSVKTGRELNLCRRCWGEGRDAGVIDRAAEPATRKAAR